MKFNFTTILIGVISIILLISCLENQPNELYTSKSDEFKTYWYEGKAEVGSYNLSQSRYGEDRMGKAMLIFVTEDFSKSKQVKLESSSSITADKFNVMKLNMTKNFMTGIYPYSLMLSSFTPIELVENPHTLKVSMSAQEWCGQVYSQVNLRQKNYEISNHSYFENEADRNQNLGVAWLEDELWNRIRLAPESLPLGEVEIIPGLFFLRLHHVEPKVEKAICSREDGRERIFYSIYYPSHKRSLVIEFERNFPHRIMGWKEDIDQRGRTLTTTAKLDKQLLIDYWTKNKNEFLYLRDSLGLSHQNF